MDNEQATFEEEEIPSEGGAGDGRQRSTIGFPYADLGEIEHLAITIHSQVGGGQCDDNQLAPWMNLSPKSSGYRVRISAARLFGVVETESGQHRLTDLGKMIVDPDRQRAARVEAFLKVPLFEKVYEQHKGGVLPPPAALERAVEALGVAPKQKSRARQVLERSAEQAGFFEQGKNRLVKPGIAPAPLQKPASVREVQQSSTDARGANHGGGGGGGDDRPPLDPMLVGLVDKLPRGAREWKAADRITWLKAATVIFQLVYGTDEEIDVYAKATRLAHFPGQGSKSQSFAGGGGVERFAAHSEPGSDEA